MLSCLVLLLSLTSHTHGENPAIKLTLTQKGLQYGAHMGAGWVQKSMENMTLPDITGGINIGLGTVHYILSGMHVSQCDFPEPSVSFSEGTGLETAVSGLSIAVTGSWNTKFGIIRDGGSFNLAVFQVEVSSLVGLNRDDEGRLSISSLSCSAAAGTVRMHLHGGASWIVQMFVDAAPGRIKKEIVGTICPGVSQYIGNLEDQLAAMEVSFQVGRALVLDIPLASAPLVESSGLGLGFKGEFYSSQSHTDPPFQAQAFSVPRQDAYMLSLGVSEFTANSASYSLYSSAFFHVSVNDSVIPEKCPLHLNTSSFGSLIPQLAKLFPGLQMELAISAREVPMFSFLPGEVQLALPAMVAAFAVQPNGTLTPLFKLGADSVFRGHPSISGGRIRGSVALSNFSLTLVSSEVGTFETAALENLVKIGIKMAVLPKLNAKLGEGFVLPIMHHFQLVNSVLKVQKGFVAMFSDVKLSGRERH